MGDGVPLIEPANVWLGATGRPGGAAAEALPAPSQIAAPRRLTSVAARSSAFLNIGFTSQSCVPLMGRCPRFRAEPTFPSRPCRQYQHGEGSPDADHDRWVRMNS